MIQKTSRPKALPNHEHCAAPAPYYEKHGITIYNADCRDVKVDADVLVFDPPYGIDYRSSHGSSAIARSIANDKDTSVRDSVIASWGKPAIVFGSWKIEKPIGTKMLLIWDTKGALGMGDLSLPWKPSHQEIYILGRGFQGKRTSDVLSFAPVQSIAKNGRLHPHQKPLGLMRDLINKCPSGVVYDPCMGVGSTLVAAKLEGREAIGVEIEERYCELAARRLDNEPRPMF